MPFAALRVLVGKGNGILEAQQLSHSLGPRSNTRAVIHRHTLRQKSLGQVTQLGLMGDKCGQTA